MAKKAVLVVDNNIDFLKVTEFRLKSKGYNIITATSGEEAIDIIKKRSIDVVFLDIKMPGIDGIETLKRIRKIKKSLPVIMMTAFYQEGKLLKESMKLNISSFIPKGGVGKETSVVMETFLRTLK